MSDLNTLIQSQMSDPSIYDEDIGLLRTKQSDILQQLLSQQTDSPQQALGRTLAASLPTAIAAMFGGLDYAGAAAPAAVTAIQQDEQRAALRRQEEQNRSKLAYSALGEQLSPLIKEKSQLQKQNLELEKLGLQPALAAAKAEATLPIEMRKIAATAAERAKNRIPSAGEQPLGPAERNLYIQAYMAETGVSREQAEKDIPETTPLARGRLGGNFLDAKNVDDRANKKNDIIISKIVEPELKSLKKVQNAKEFEPGPNASLDKDDVSRIVNLSTAVGTVKDATSKLTRIIDKEGTVEFGLSPKSQITQAEKKILLDNLATASGALDNYYKDTGAKGTESVVNNINSRIDRLSSIKQFDRAAIVELETLQDALEGLAHDVGSNLGYAPKGTLPEVLTQDKVLERYREAGFKLPDSVTGRDPLPNGVEERLLKNGRIAVVEKDENGQPMFIGFK